MSMIMFHIDFLSIFSIILLKAIRFVIAGYYKCEVNFT